MTTDTPRILLSGNFKPQDFEFCWLAWLQAHDYSVQEFDKSGTLQKIVPSHLLQRILWRFFPGVLVSYISRQFLKAAYSFRPDLIIVVNGNMLTLPTLQAAKKETKATLFHFYNEDFFNPLNTTDYLREAASFYDHFFTTKRFNVPELAEIGISEVSFIPHGYRPNCHFPLAVSQADIKRYGSDLVFVGTWEAQRAELLAQLKGFDLRIWGNNWHKAQQLSLDQYLQNRPVYCEDMSRVFNSSKICLAFLRKANRDRHTSRTFEIPACGGFQMTERTEEILSFFDEGQEIECFASVDELKDKANYYLKHDSQRQRIASAGLARVQRSRYSFTDRLETILNHYLKKNYE